MIAVIIKTHNDYRVIEKCIGSLEEQTYRDFHIFVMDTASDRPQYLEKYKAKSNVTIFYDSRDLGFCVGNNVATKKVIHDYKYVFYLNPDAFLDKDFIENAFHVMENDKSEKIGIVTGKLRWYDLTNDKKSQIIDCAAIEQRWFGRWQNRGMGKLDEGQYETDENGESVLAACGALLFCRSKALLQSQLSPGEYFNASFFMYKDDIEISLRIRKAGYQIRYYSHLLGWHCRGWQRKNRKLMQKKYRLHAARNEIFINRQLALHKHFYSAAKYILVKFGF